MGFFHNSLKGEKKAVGSAQGLKGAIEKKMNTPIERAKSIGRSQAMNKIAEIAKKHKY